MPVPVPVPEPQYRRRAIFHRKSTGQGHWIRAFLRQNRNEPPDPARLKMSGLQIHGGTPQSRLLPKAARWDAAADSRENGIEPEAERDSTIR
jgi:hypothetical protein